MISNLNATRPGALSGGLNSLAGRPAAVGAPTAANPDIIDYVGSSCARVARERCGSQVTPATMARFGESAKLLSHHFLETGADRALSLTARQAVQQGNGGALPAVADEVKAMLPAFFRRYDPSLPDSVVVPPSPISATGTSPLTVLRAIARHGLANWMDSAGDLALLSSRLLEESGSGTGGARPLPVSLARGGSARKGAMRGCAVDDTKCYNITLGWAAHKKTVNICGDAGICAAFSSYRTVLVEAITGVISLVCIGATVDSVGPEAYWICQQLPIAIVATTVVQAAYLGLLC